MALFSKIGRRSGRERLLAAEAFGWLVACKVAVHTVPFRWLSRTLGRADAETAGEIVPADRAVAVRISWAVQAVARHVPLGFVCLPQALAAQRMLRRRGVSTTIYFGVAPQPNDPVRMLAHAWLRAGDKVVTGEHPDGQYVVVAKFADER